MTGRCSRPAPRRTVYSSSAAPCRSAQPRASSLTRAWSSTRMVHLSTRSTIARGCTDLKAAAGCGFARWFRSVIAARTTGPPSGSAVTGRVPFARRLQRVAQRKRRADRASMNAAEIRHGTDLARDMQRRPRVPRSTCSTPGGWRGRRRADSDASQDTSVRHRRPGYVHSAMLTGGCGRHDAHLRPHLHIYDLSRDSPTSAPGLTG